jgi:YD repeat-containing protein
VLISLSTTLSLASETYQYDRYNRLSRIHNGSLNQQFTYDRSGNRIAITSNSDDRDFDGIPDTVESSRCTSATSSDTDNDGIPDNIEDTNGNGIIDSGETDPCNADTDGDGIQDGTELGYFVPRSPDTNGAVFIPDMDPSTVTNPLSVDTDGDGIPDGIEDTNHNGILEGGETDPCNADTDGDGLDDGVEDSNHNGIVDFGETDPHNMDSDGDGFSDGFEVSHGMNPLYKDIIDTDGDGLVDALENATCTSASNPDTDGDSIQDGIEDANHNGILDSDETNPCDPDTDGDGLRDDVDPEPTIHIDARKLTPINYLLLKKK